MEFGEAPKKCLGVGSLLSPHLCPQAVMEELAAGRGQPSHLLPKGSRRPLSLGISVKCSTSY